ncbi:MAG: putative Na+/H+ antiporter [Lentisphaeraceae bacterium]|nr:putative Na+/H+ antiporter [Lentisphaeraceae bacterium]
MSFPSLLDSGVCTLASGVTHFFKSPNLMLDPFTQKLALVIFALAITHTFLVSKFLKLSHRFPHESISHKLCHILGEVEAVFGIWALFLVFFMIGMHGKTDVFNYLQHTIDFTEPALVFVIMTVAATLPVIYFANRCITAIANLIPLKMQTSFYFSALIIGPLLGSFITEPAAMTVTAIILKKAYYDKGISQKFMYATLGVLFVNISIGGTLTHFAAPPVLMVSKAWSWDMSYMIGNFGWKSAIAVVLNTSLITYMFRKELAIELKESNEHPPAIKIKPFVIIVQLIFLAAIVIFAHDMVIFLGIFVFFLGWCEITSSYQEPLKIKSALLVGFFLAGLVVIGKLQAWWLKPLMGEVKDWQLFIGTSMLTGITDNAALTFLGTTVDGLSIKMKYALVAGAVAGGGLTVIANAPNPAGFGILKDSFGKDGISPVGLLKASLVPTIIAMCCLWFLGTPYPPATAGEATALIIEVKSVDEFAIDNVSHDFEKLKEAVYKKAEATGGRLRLVLMLPDSHAKTADGKHAEAMTTDQLRLLFEKIYGAKVKNVNTGQVILDFDQSGAEAKEHH